MPGHGGEQARTVLQLGELPVVAVEGDMHHALLGRLDNGLHIIEGMAHRRGGCNPALQLAALVHHLVVEDFRRRRQLGAVQR
ncbi:hypothetical protein D3C84_1154200 [compost metagenome]